MRIRLPTRLQLLWKTLAALLLVLALWINILFVASAVYQLFDFGSFIAAGRAAASAGNPYSPDNPLVFKLGFERLGIGSSLQNANPPISLLLFEPLARIPPLVAINAWRLISAGMYLGIVVILFREHRLAAISLRGLWALSLAGFWHTLQLGQIYTVLLLFVAAATVFMRRRSYWVASVAVGLAIALKPNFVMWAVVLGVAGYPTILIGALATAAVLSLIPAIMFGPGIYFQWLSVANQFGALGFPGNNSLPGLLVRIGEPLFGYVLGLTAALGLVAIAWRRRPIVEKSSGLGIIAALLLGPISWTGYTILLLPYLLGERKWDSLQIAAAAILAVPFLVVLVEFQEGLTGNLLFGWLYGWALLALVPGSLPADDQGGGRVPAGESSASSR